MVVLAVDLKNGTFTEREWKGESSPLECALSLQSEYGDESLVIGSVAEEKSGDGDASLFPIVYHSEISGKREIAALTSSHGYSLFRLGIKALVITGRADKLRYITLSPSRREILPSENMRAESSLSFESVVITPGEIALTSGIAADKGVWYGALQCRGRNVPGLGLGHAFFSHNLKSLVLTSFSDGRTERKSEAPQKRIRNTFMEGLRTYGEYSIIPSSSRLGWTPLYNYSDRFDPRVANIDGRSLAERYGNYPDGCMGCSLSCLRRTKDGNALPRWTDLLYLGPNIGIFDLANIQKIYDAAVSNGLEIPTLGGLLSYILSLPPEERSLYLKDGSVENITAFISRLSTGSVLPKGLVSLPEAVQGYDHRPVLYDVRGAFAEAILLSQGLDFTLPGTLFFPKKSVKAECAAIFALYETVYTLALISLGCSPFTAFVEYFSRLPDIVFRMPLLARIALKRFTAYGYKAEELLDRGYRLLERLNPGWHDIPRCFTFNSVSSYDASTVPIRKLQAFYDEEKLRLLIFLKSSSAKRARKDGVKSAAVAPSEDRGREADPGLSR